MADFVDSGLRLLDTMADHVAYIRNLKENLEALEAAMERLKQVYEDVKERVEREEQLRLERKHTHEVAGWLDRVLSMQEKVSKILQEGKEEEQKKYAIMSTYTVGKRVSKMVNEVNELRIERGGFKVVAMDVFRAPFIIERPMEKTMGLELMVEGVWRCIEDTNLQTIGLYGLGGVGKTTLLKKINNEFLNRSSHGFDAVIWVSVSKQPDLKKIQDAILEELQLGKSKNEKRRCKSEDNDRGRRKSQYNDLRTRAIRRRLEGKKFVLLLDDIWERLDLVNLGVPIQELQKGSKVVFTTRSLEICGQMGAQPKIKVECLTAEAALDLFWTKVGQDTLSSHPCISELAEIMAAECKGLPLALVTVGRAMASRKNPEEWEHAISILRNSPSDIPGMNDVLLPLKFSFDRLENDLLKSCFLYCSLFPEVSKEELIDLWIGEGFLGKSADLYGRLINDRKKGKYIIGSLKLACLIESGESEELVTMHQMIRDMALLECGERVKIYVKRGDHSTQAYGSGSWNKIERILLWDHSIEDLPINNLQLPNLLTLICKASMQTTFPAGFIHLMPALTVLDLSKSFMLRELPAEIGKLINLQYLNLSDTAISELPTDLRNLTKLRCLLLSNCTRFKIQSGMISNFQLLEVFSTGSCDEDLLGELEHLLHISEISIQIVTTYTSLARLLRSPKLQKCLKTLYFQCGKDRKDLDFIEILSLRRKHFYSIEVSPSLLRRMERLELNSGFLQELKISPETESIRHHYFDNLCWVSISCYEMSNATWLICAPRLQHLTLSGCSSMEEVIGGNLGLVEIEENVDLFSSLTTLHLEDLPKLKSICPHALPFRFLMKIKVTQCPNLKKLPFDSNGAKNSLEEIYGEASWWEELQWEDEAIKQVFCSKFVAKPR